MQAAITTQSNLPADPVRIDLSGQARRQSDLSLLSCGDGLTTSTTFLQKAIDGCAAGGGGTVVIPAGVYLTGTLWMRSNVTLHLEAGATLLGLPDVAAFPIWASKWEGSAAPTHAALI